MQSFKTMLIVHTNHEIDFGKKPSENPMASCLFIFQSLKTYVPTKNEFDFLD